MMEHDINHILEAMQNKRQNGLAIPAAWKERAKKYTEDQKQLELLFRAGPSIDRALALNVIARSGVFGIGKGSGKKSYEREVPCYMNGVKLTMVGPDLTQEHYNVLLTLTQCSAWAAVPAGDTLIMSRYALLKKGLNWDCQGYNYKKLHNILSDLTKTTFIVEDERVNPSTKIPLSGVSIKFLSYNYTEAPGGDQLLRISLSKELAQHYQPSLMHLTSLSQRDALQSKPLALFLHTKFSSHSGDMERHPVSIEKLHQISGAKTPLKQFKYKLKTALDELVEIEFLESWNYVMSSQFISFKRKFVGQEAAYWKKMKRKGLPYADEALSVALFELEDLAHDANARVDNMKELIQDFKEQRFNRN